MTIRLTNPSASLPRPQNTIARSPTTPRPAATPHQGHLVKDSFESTGHQVANRLHVRSAAEQIAHQLRVNHAGEQVANTGNRIRLWAAAQKIAHAGDIFQQAPGHCDRPSNGGPVITDGRPVITDGRPVITDGRTTPWNDEGYGERLEANRETYERVFGPKTVPAGTTVSGHVDIE